MAELLQISSVISADAAIITKIVATYLLLLFIYLLTNIHMLYYAVFLCHKSLHK